jgi:2',3'-cyclic-nucleotide 3'-phosphodiesterase/NEDD4-binding protein 2
MNNDNTNPEFLKTIKELYPPVFQRNLIILKGVSGAGKTTFCDLIAGPKVVICADDFFYEEGVYQFDGNYIGQAHAECRAKFDRWLNDDVITNIIISNTNTKPSDYKYYVDQANAKGLRITYVVLENRHGNKNVHDVPEHVLERQEQNIRQNLKLR